MCGWGATPCTSPYVNAYTMRIPNICVCARYLLYLVDIGGNSWMSNLFRLNRMSLTLQEPPQSLFLSF